MNKFEKYIKDIKHEYPQTMSKDQFYRVAHISKSTALFLLQSGLIPCTDSGKKTHRYTIRTEDVIAYLIDRQINPQAYKASDGWYAGTTANNRGELPNASCIRLTAAQEAKLRKYLSSKLHSYDDLLTVKDLASFSGYSPTTVVNWCNTRQIKCFRNKKRFVIPKASIIEYFSSPGMCNHKLKSSKHKQLLWDFIEIHGITL